MVRYEGDKFLSAGGFSNVIINLKSQDKQLFWVFLNYGNQNIVIMNGSWL